MNKVKCTNCKAVIESRYRHDFVQCHCGKIFVDGGNEYFRCGYDKPESFIRIYEDGREESMVDSIKAYNETHPVKTVYEFESIAKGVLPELSFEERTKQIREEILVDLENLKGVIDVLSYVKTMGRKNYDNTK